MRKRRRSEDSSMSGVSSFEFAEFPLHSVFKELRMGEKLTKFSFWSSPMYGVQTATMGVSEFGHELQIYRASQEIDNIFHFWKFSNAWSFGILLDGSLEIKPGVVISQPSFFTVSPNPGFRCKATQGTTVLIAGVPLKQSPSDNLVSSFNLLGVIERPELKREFKRNFVQHAVRSGMGASCTLSQFNNRKGGIIYQEMSPSPEASYGYQKGGFFSLILGNQGCVRFRNSRFRPGMIVFGASSQKVLCEVEEKVSFISIIPHCEWAG